MGWRQTAWIVLVTAAVAGCGEATQYRNERNPAADLTRDTMDCRNRSQVPTNDRLGGEYNRATYVVDDDMLTRCLADRGWQPIPGARPPL
jgi:hypothetical protein